MKLSLTLIATIASVTNAYNNIRGARYPSEYERDEPLTSTRAEIAQTVPSRTEASSLSVAGGRGHTTQDFPFDMSWAVETNTRDSPNTVPEELPALNRDGGEEVLGLSVSEAIKSAPAATITCAPDETRVSFVIRADDEASELSVNIVEKDNKTPLIVLTGFEDLKRNINQFCLPTSLCYTASIKDAGDNGFCCGSTIGYYQIFLEEDLTYAGPGIMRSEISFDIGSSCGDPSA